ncbi:thioredoxin TrxC [Aliamphritea hakodatensis]|uniref:thioredoxin TrxC n=1 Tax=Aliamphritea hakodatensis TaxID=2895352 RepID=UPI0022FD4053|nr:thioredoxin TrxC [Aliamphritea hakodatensis]
MNISCPHCNVTNRIPAERLQDKPNCGKCKQAIFAGKPVNLTAANYSKQVLQNDLPVLVDCWASWCGPCQQFAPVFDQAAKTFEPRLRLVKLDTEAEQNIAAQLQIRSIPTLILFKNGKEAARMSGAMPLGQLQQWLRQQGVEV